MQSKKPKERGIQVGIVKSNYDYKARNHKQHQVLVQFPVHKTDQEIKSYWCRMLTPMAGNNRGLVIFPEVGTEVVVAFAAQSSTPIILGAVYNDKEDTTKVYHNDDQENNKRVFWSRNDHMVIFDDTAGEEKVQLGAQASTELDVTSAPIYHTLDSSQKKITEYCDGNTEWEASQKISIKCTDFVLEASNSICTDSSATTAINVGADYTIEATGNLIHQGTKAKYNCGDPATPKSAESFPDHKHSPSGNLSLIKRVLIKVAQSTS